MFDTRFVDIRFYPESYERSVAYSTEMYKLKYELSGNTIQDAVKNVLNDAALSPVINF